MKNGWSQLLVLLLTLTIAFCFSFSAFAKVELDITKKIPLEYKPLDLAVSPDGSTAYILCQNKIVLYSLRENKATDTIPIKGEFTQISLSPKGEQLFLTDTKAKEVSIIRISEIFDHKIGGSAVIGKADAPVSVFAFLDYQ